MLSVKINFENEAARKHFVIWLSEQGEQDYWTWMEYREQEEPGDITAITFEYDYKSCEEINTKSGRLCAK